MDRRRPDWILLNTVAIAGRNSNATTATATGCTRYGKSIEVSFSLEHPPRPSILYVHSSDTNLSVPPTIVRTAEDLLLVAVNMGSGRYSHPSYDCDYFIYRAHSTSCGPSLHRLPRPRDEPYFNYNDVGLLPRPDGQYTAAALIPTATANFDQYKLHVFHSHTQSWSCRTLSVERPQEPFPVKLPQLQRHLTSGVITIGGEGGTIGWVDHWRGILFCDVLHQEPFLHGVPIPLPLKELRDHGEDFPVGPGWQRRGIAFSRDEGLKLVHLEVTATRLPYKDPETGSFAFKVDGWALTTWSNRRMTNSYEDWHRDCTVHASDITIDNPAVSQALESGLLKHNHHGGVAGEEHRLALRNLVMSQPAHCMNGGKEDVICLVATKKHMHPAAWILTVDMKNAKIQAVEEFGTTQSSSSIIYCPSMISKYMI